MYVWQYAFLPIHPYSDALLGNAYDGVHGHPCPCLSDPLPLTLHVYFWLLQGDPVEYRRRWDERKVAITFNDDGTVTHITHVIPSFWIGNVTDLDTAG